MLRSVEQVEDNWTYVGLAIIISLSIALSVHFLTPKPLAMSGETSATLTTQNERYMKALRDIERTSSLDEAREIAEEALR